MAEADDLGHLDLRDPAPAISGTKVLTVFREIYLPRIVLEMNLDPDKPVAKCARCGEWLTAEPEPTVCSPEFGGCGRSASGDWEKADTVFDRSMCDHERASMLDREVERAASNVAYDAGVDVAHFLEVAHDYAHGSSVPRPRGEGSVRDALSGAGL